MPGENCGHRQFFCALKNSNRGALPRPSKISRLHYHFGLLELDVTGLYVTPGFINLHSHASPNALATAENMLTPGVTTELLHPDVVEVSTLPSS